MAPMSENIKEKMNRFQCIKVKLFYTPKKQKDNEKLRKFVWYDKRLTLKSVYKSIKKINILIGKKDKRQGRSLANGTSTNSQ